MVSHFLNISKLIIIYIIIVIIQILYISYKKNKVENAIHTESYFNIKNKKNLIEFINKTLKERLDLLNSHKLSYKEWIDYNNKYNDVYFDKTHKYYIMLYEIGKDEKTIIARSHTVKKYIDLEWTNILNDQQNNLLFVRQKNNPQLINNMYDLSSSKKPTNITYFWTDYNNKTFQNDIMRKESIIYRWEDKRTDKKGIISIGFSVEDVSSTNIFYYFNSINYIYIAAISLLISLVSFVIYKLNVQNNSFDSIIKPIGFLILLNLYLLFFLQSKEYIGSSEIEKGKITDINSGTLSVSFLVGVNTFIITSLKKSLKKNLFIESALIFSISLILLLFSAFKITNFTTLDELVKDRISHQLVFNFSIILNIFVIINYIIHILQSKKT